MQLSDYQAQILNFGESISNAAPVNSPITALAPAYYLSLTKDKSSPISKKCISLVESCCDLWAATMQKNLKKDGPNCTSEWEIMVISQITECAGNLLNKTKVSQWKKWANEYCILQTKRPFYYTAYNHEIMRCSAMYYFGSTYNIKSFRDSAHKMALQLLNYVTPLGFWEEGPHHGTSLRYNYIMLHGLAWMSRFTKDKALISATKNLAEFMTMYSYPDGSTIGALDGRQTFVAAKTLGFQCGLELAPKAVSLQEKIFQASMEATKAQNTAKYITDYFSVSSAIYFSKFKIKPSKPKTLPPPKNINHIETSPFLNCLVQTKGDWTCTLSAHTSHIPKETRSVFRLERQSRIELWHKDCKVIVGGGHNKIGNPIPYTNFMGASGFLDQDFEYGLIKGSDKKANHAMYYARSAKVAYNAGTPTLTLHYAHGTIEYAIRVLNNQKVEINWSVSHAGFDKMAIQLPITVPADCKLNFDGKIATKKYGACKKLLKAKQIKLLQANQKTITIKTKNAIGLRYPNMPLITYVEDEKLFFDKTEYHIAILSSQFNKPPNKLKGTWQITIK